MSEWKGEPFQDYKTAEWGSLTYILKRCYLYVRIKDFKIKKKKRKKNKMKAPWKKNKKKIKDATWAVVWEAL